MSITSSTIGKRTFKIVLLGDTSTGKTSIIERFVNNKFEEKDNVSLYIRSQQSGSISSAKMSRSRTPHVVCNFGTLLDRRGIAASSLVILRMQCALSLYLMSTVPIPLITGADTLANVQSWIDLFRENRGDRTVMTICGNKADLERYNWPYVSEYDKKLLSQYVEKYKIKYYEVSALTGNNVDSMFYAIIDQINSLQHSKRSKIMVEDNFDLIPPNTTEALQSDRGNENHNDTDIV